MPGSIRFDGREIAHEPVYRRALSGLGRSYQITSVFPEFTRARQRHARGAGARGTQLSFWRPLAAERGARGARAARRSREVGLARRRTSPVAALAHGERRQLEVAMTLATRPQLLLLDEPMAGMSLAESERMVSCSPRSRAATASCWSSTTWTPCSSSPTASRCSVYGRVIACGDPASIRDNAEVRAAYLGRPGSSWPDARCSTSPTSPRTTARARCCSACRFAAEAGECITLIGRNGMGKSTTVKSVLGMLPTHARARAASTDARSADWPSYRIAQAGIGSCRRCGRSFPTLTVRENLVATAAAPTGAARARGRSSASTRCFRGLRERERNLGSQLSGGEQQMLAIGRALMTNPRLLILDEATEGLAPLVRAEIWRCLAALKREGLTLIVDRQEHRARSRASPTATYIVEKGRVAWHGDSPALLGRSRDTSCSAIRQGCNCNDARSIRRSSPTLSPKTLPAARQVSRTSAAPAISSSSRA